MTMFTIKVPGSSANIGPGFDSMGLAVSKYLTLTVKTGKTWQFFHQSDPSFLPKVMNYKHHYIYKIAKQTAKKYKASLPPCKVELKSEIPLARGLGSSAAAVIAGIELANQLCQLSLTDEEKLMKATLFEGHPDNVAPSLLGGCVLSVTSSKQKVDYLKFNELKIDLVLFIPNHELKTKEARQVLPKQMHHKEAVEGSSISNLMVAALIQKQYELAGQMMEKDRFHEPYRAKLIPNYDEIKEKAKAFGAYGTVISGAGPTMISFVPKNQGATFVQKLKQAFPHHLVDTVHIDQKGLNVHF